MCEQVSLFDEANNFEVVNGNKNSDLLKCYKSEFVSEEWLSVSDLFSGFNTIKIITFSYDIAFIDKLMSYFDYGEIILGGSFLVEKDKKLTGLLVDVCTNAYEAGEAIKRYDNLVDRLKNGNLEFRTPFDVLDHRKMYLLKSDDGRTRVITPSANGTTRAWNGSHLEYYDYDDTEESYVAHEQDFETAWQEAQEIPLSVISSKKVDDLVEGNAILKSVKETGKTVVLKQAQEEIYSFENIKYTIDHENIREKYGALLNGVNSKAQDGFIEIIPKTVEKIEYNQKKIRQKEIQKKTLTKQYPSLTFDFFNKTCFLDNNIIPLNPTEKEIRCDIEEMINIFNNFDDFVGDIEKLKITHFKLINAIFCSPFNAKLRCVAKLMGISTYSLPLFALISSETASSGKSFIIKAALKLMTGKELDGVNACDFPTAKVKDVQMGCKGVPFFIDEIDNKYFSSVRKIIKNPEVCENNQIEEMPMLLFASNNVLKPDEPVRKRMLFFTVNNSLPSTIDKTAYDSRGKAIIKNLGTGFYREYLKRMIEKVTKEIDFLILRERELPRDYYVDLMKISSETIISIYKDFGYSIPFYMKKLTWNDDYSIDCNASEVINDIKLFYERNKKSCHIDKDTVTIELGTDKDSQRMINSWKNILPAEMRATVQTTSECSKIIINKQELELRLGHKLGGFFFKKR